MEMWYTYVNMMFGLLVCASVLAFGNAENTKSDAHFRVYPVYAHASLIGSVSKPNLLQQIPRPQPPPPNPPPPPQPPQPQPQQDPIDPYRPPMSPAEPEPLEPYRPQSPYNPEPQYPHQPQAPVQPQPELEPQPQPQPQPQLQPQPQIPHRGFSVKDIEHKPIFVFTTTDYKSYDIVYASAGIGGLNADAATKYIADFLVANDTEKLVIVFNYLNFPFTKLPDLPIARLILPNDLKLSFFAEPSIDIPIVVVFTKDQLNALDNYVQNSHVSLVGEIKLPRPTPARRTRIIHQ